MFRNGLEGWHVIVLLVIVVLLFGTKRLPEIAKSVGQSLKIFKSEVKDLTSDSTTTSAPPPQSPVAQAPVAQADVAPTTPPAPDADAASPGTPGPQV